MTVYEKNILALKEYHPEIAEILEGSIDTDHIQVIQAKSGAARMLVRTKTGTTFAVHNEDNPIKVARRTANKISHTEGVLVVLGMGLGYLAKSLAKNLDDGAALIVYEADPGIFKTALQKVDLRNLLVSPRVKVLVGPEANIAQWTYYYLLKMGGTVQVARFEPAFRLNPELYEKKFGPELVQTTKSAITNLATANTFGPIFTKNILESLPHIIMAPGVNVLHNQFKGKPAIIVAAGPSLGKNVHLLKKAKHRAVIICADTVLGYLLARQITPDFVVSVDPQIETYHKFEEVNIPNEVSLVFHPSCHEQIVKHFPGPKFVTETGMLAYQWVKEFFPSKGAIDQDVQCQVHMGFNLAQWIGCDPIILIGQDLCYTDDRMHVQGGSYLSEKEEQHYVNTGAKVKNIFGEQVGTYPVYLSYRSLWEKKVRGFGGTFLNATEGGLNIAGAKNCLLADALEAWCSEGRFSVIETIQRLPIAQKFPDISPLLQEVRDRLRDFHRLHRVSRRLVAMLTEMQRLRNVSKRVTDDLVRLSHRSERLTRLIPRYANALGLLQMIDFRLELYMAQDRTNAIDEVKDELERLDQQIERGLRFYGDIQRAVPFLEECLGRVESRLNQLQSIIESQALSPRGQGGGQDLALVEKCMDLELFDLANDIINGELRTNTSGDRDPSVEILRMRLAVYFHQFQMALEVGDSAYQTFSGHPEIELLREEIVDQWQSWKQKVKAIEQENIQTQRPALADGDFYYRLGNYERAVVHYQRQAESEVLNPQLRGEAWYRVAQAYQRMQKPELVVEALERALVLDPTNSRVYFDLGVQSLTNGALESAQRFFEKGSEVSFDDPEYCEAVGSIFSAAGAHREAIVFFERGLSRNPGDGNLLEKINHAYQSIFEVTYSA